MLCPCKPHPFGNEYHSACGGMSGIMFVIKMVESKDQLLDLGASEFEGVIGKMGGLLLQMLKSCVNSGRYEAFMF